MPYESIRRGVSSALLKYTKAGDQYCHIQRSCDFTDSYQTCIRSMFVWPRTDKHGNEYHIFRVLTSTSREGKKGQLVAPTNRKMISYRVNNKTNSVTIIGMKKQFTVDYSPDHRFTIDEFKSLLLSESRIVDNLIKEYKHNMNTFW